MYVNYNSWTSSEYHLFIYQRQNNRSNNYYYKFSWNKKNQIRFSWMKFTIFLIIAIKKHLNQRIDNK